MTRSEAASGTLFVLVILTGPLFTPAKLMGKVWPFPTDGLPASPLPIHTCRAAPPDDGVAAAVGGLGAGEVSVGVMVVGGAAEKLTRAFAVPLVCFTLRYSSVFVLSKYQLDPD